jgi:hypothetical protein
LCRAARIPAVRPERAKGLPREVRARRVAPPRDTALDTARKDPGTTERILELGGTVPREAEAGPAALQALVAREVARWTPVLRSAVDANP